MINFERKDYFSKYWKLKRERLEITTNLEKWGIFAVRVDGFLLDVISFEPNCVKYYPLKQGMLPDDCHITVENILEDIDLTLPQNSHMRDFDYFKAKYQDRLSS